MAIFAFRFVVEFDRNGELADDVKDATQQSSTSGQPSIIIVEVLGYGGSQGGEQEQPKRNDKQTSIYDVNSRVLVLGNGALSEKRISRRRGKARTAIITTDKLVALSIASLKHGAIEVRFGESAQLALLRSNQLIHSWERRAPLLSPLQRPSKSGLACSSRTETHRA